MKKIASTLGKCFLICSIFILFASCENFLKGANIHSQLEESIEIANSEPISYYIIADAESGTAIPTQVTKRKKESFDLKFIPSEGWQFICWEAINTDTQQVDPDAIYFTDPQSLETSAKILKPGKNIQIHPKCILLPAIVSVAPEDAAKCYANASIVITFNMPMEDASVSSSDSIFNFNNIAITYVGQDLTDCFEAPVFNPQKTILTIDTKGDALSEFIALQNRTFIDLQITFGPNIVVLNQGIESQLTQSSQSFTIRRNADTETVKPLKDIFFVRTEPITFETAATLSPENCYTQDDLSTFDNAKILKNRTEHSVYIYAVFHDDDSGIRKITVTEQRTNKKSGTIVFEQPVSIDYTSKNTEFHNEGDGSVTACIKYDLKSDDGAILLSVAAVDVCNNVSIPQTVTAIKDSKIDLSGVELYNLDYIYQEYSEDATSYYCTDNHKKEGQKYTLDEYNQMIKELKINSLKRRIYGDYLIPEMSLRVKLIYQNDAGMVPPGDMSYDDAEKRWKYTISDVENISNLRIKLSVTDELYRTVEKDFGFPDIPSPIHVHSYSISDTAHGNNIAFSDSPNSTKVCYMGLSSEDKAVYVSTRYSFSISVPKEEFNCKFFSLNDFLAGSLTENSYTQNDFTVSSTLSPVIVKSASMSKSDRDGYYKINYEIDTTNGNPWLNYQTIYAEFSASHISCEVCQIPKDTIKGSFYVLDLPKRYVGLCGLRFFGINSEGISKDYETYGDPLTNKYFMGCPYNDIMDTSKPFVVDYSLWEYYQEPFPNNYETICSTLGTTMDRPDYIIPVGVRDNNSGIDKVVLTVNGYTWNYNANDLVFKTLGFFNYSAYGDVAIPKVWDVDKEYNNLNIRFIDKAGNFIDWSGSYIYRKLPSFTISNNGNNYTTVNLVSQKDLRDVYQWRLQISQFSTSNNKWVNYMSKTLTPEKVQQDDGKYIYSFSNISDLTSEYFYKIIPMGTLEDTLRTSDYGSSTPCYFYTGSQRNTHNYDYILQNGKDKESVLVYSDAPTFIHTLVTKQPLSVCEEWDIDFWEHNHKHCGDKQWSFTNPNALKYEIPVDKMDSGDCYVVIAHFADGTSAISEVMQKD